MKLIKSSMLIGAALLCLASCREQYEPYTPGQPENSNIHNVHFQVPQSTEFQMDPAEPTEVTFRALRDSVLVGGKLTMDPLEVPVEIKANNAVSEGIFSLSKVEFPKDSVWTDFTVSFPNAEAGVQYSATLSVTDPAYTHIYSSGIRSISFSVQRVKWNSIGFGYYYDDLIAYWSKKDYDPVEVEFFQSDSDSKSFRIADPYSKILEIIGQTPAETPSEFISLRIINKGDKVGSTTVTIDDGIYFEEIATGFLQPTYGMAITLLHPVNFTSTADPTYWKHSAVWNYQEDGTPGEAALAPFYYMYDYPGGFNYSEYDDDIYIIFPGFTPTDYNLSLEADYPQDGVTPVYVEAGSDIAYVKYAVYEGELGSSLRNSKVEAIIEGTENAETYSDFDYDEEDDCYYGTIGIAPEKTGKYTVIVVGYDEEDEAQNSTYAVVNHIAAGDSGEYAVEVSVFTEATPSRYTGYTEYDSFAYCVSGKDIIEAHIGIYPSNKVDEATMNELKFEGEPVSDEILAAINGNGGYYTVVGGLSAGVEYAVVVWATNGTLDSFVCDFYETTPDPEVWNTVGTATWTDAFVGPVYGAESLSYEVELQESQDTPGRYRLVNVYGEAFPYNDPGDWDDSRDYYLVINADDPDYVWIEFFDSGCDWGDGNFRLASEAGIWVYEDGLGIEEVKDMAEEEEIVFGTMKDNVITFPPYGVWLSLANYYGGQWIMTNEEPYTITFNFEESAAVAAKAAKPSVLERTAKKNVQTIRKATAPIVFERDPQPLQVKTVRMDNVRKEKATGKKAFLETVQPIR